MAIRKFSPCTTWIDTSQHSVALLERVSQVTDWGGHEFRFNKAGAVAFWTGLVMLLFGSAYAAKHYDWYCARTWQAMHMPIDLRVGSASSQEFTVNLNENFLILVEVDRSAPNDVTERLLGIAEPGFAGPADVHGIELRWSVVRDGSVLKRGFSDGKNQGF
jgi:hypothetical protein